MMMNWKAQIVCITADHKSMFYYHLVNFSLLSINEQQITCHIEVRGNLAVSQCKPDKAETHAQSSYHIRKIISFPYNI